MFFPVMWFVVSWVPPLQISVYGDAPTGNSLRTASDQLLPKHKLSYDCHRQSWRFGFAARSTTLDSDLLSILQFIGMFESAQPAIKLACHCEERSDVAIFCLAARCRKMRINIENLRCSMSIGSYKSELRCRRFPRQGFAPPRNDMLDGAVQQNDRHQFTPQNECPIRTDGALFILRWAAVPDAFPAAIP